MSKLKTAIIGFGRIAHGYSSDPAMSKLYKYATHAQVLRDHPGFAWQTVVDPLESSREIACQKWGITHAAKSIEELESAPEIEVAILSMPPDQRLKALEALPSLKAVLVEKPLASSLESARQFVDYCLKRNILLQVNLTRRADQATRELAAGRLAEIAGNIQVVNGIYGNGLLNNGTHMIDLCRMLFGEISSVQAIALAECFEEGPIVGDRNPAFVMYPSAGPAIVMRAVKFANYRENGLDIWGEKSRFAYMHGGMLLLDYPSCASRVLSTDKEIPHDCPRQHQSTLGHALYSMYDNLYRSISGTDELWSSGESALQTASIIESIEDSLDAGGDRILMDSYTMATVCPGFNR